jgi:hypothetical protein
VADPLDDAEVDVLAFLGFRLEHCQNWSNTHWNG